MLPKLMCSLFIRDGVRLVSKSFDPNFQSAESAQKRTSESRGYELSAGSAGCGARWNAETTGLRFSFLMSLGKSRGYF